MTRTYFSGIIKAQTKKKEVINMFNPEEERGEQTEGFEPIEEPADELTPPEREDQPEILTVNDASGPEIPTSEAAHGAEAEELYATAQPEDSPGGQTAADGGDYFSAASRQDYADAHYEPAGSSPVPPRYYTPPEKPAREPKKKRSGLFWKAACLALACAILGGMLGAALTGRQLNGRIDALEQSLSESSKALDALQSGQAGSAGTGMSLSSESGLSASQIYDLACQQVVGITTNVTTTNFFGMTTSSAVSGSGFIISEDGYIITNYHVVEYAVQGKLPITVMLYDGTKFDAEVVGTEQANDLAVLKIDANGLKPASFGDSDSLLVGDPVYAVGNPLGELEFSMTSGHVSALNRVISTEEAEAINMFQVDAAVNPGNSGGPVYNAKGQVVGVVTAKYSDSGVEGLGFAIPVNDASRIAEDLVTKGYVTGKAYLGVSLRDDYTAMYARYFGMPVGAYVAKAQPGSAAEKAGLQEGDVITKLGDEEIGSYNDLKNAIKQYSAGDQAELTFYRAGESRTVTVTFDEAIPEGVHS